MPFGGAIGGMFIGSLSVDDKRFLKKLLVNARGAGYTRFVEPCAGAFAMSFLAREAGFVPQEIEASDISMFSAVLGRVVERRDLDGLDIHASGFDEQELADHATALYAHVFSKIALQAGKQYFYELLRDLREQREAHLERICERLTEYDRLLFGMRYESKCMFAHLREVLDDPHAVVVLCPPTYRAGYEKFFDTGGRVHWAEPEYEIFDPKTGMQALVDMTADAKALVIIYEESEATARIGEPIYARQAGRVGTHMYLTANRAIEAGELAKGKTISRANEKKIRPIDAHILPIDHEITGDSVLAYRPIDSDNATYYRRLWTHNFVGAAAQLNLAVLIDGYVAGVFGLSTQGLVLGYLGQEIGDSVFLMYGISAKSRYRLGRLLYMVAMNEETLRSVLNDIEMQRAKSIKTVTMTKYPENKEMRGLMKQVRKIKDPQHGFKITYETDLKRRSKKETITEWLTKEIKWQASRRQKV